LRKIALLTGFLFFCLITILPAQTHNAVSLDDQRIYSFLEQAELRGYIDRLPQVKPYTKSFVLGLLEDLNRTRRRMSVAEQVVFQGLYNNYVIDKDQDLLKDGDYRFDDEVFPFRVETSADMKISANASSIKDSAALAEGRMGASGDLGESISWGLALEMGLYKVDDYNSATSYGPTAYAPYSYSKDWEGGINYITSPNKYNGMPTDLALGRSYETEIAASFFDNQAEFRFGRLKREWGAVGESSLFLDGDAQAFMGIEGTVKPRKWVNFSFITGTLDYGENFREMDDFSIKGTASTQQNMFSLLQVELMPTDWLYLSAFDGGVFLKRSELGYWMPLMSRFLNQNNVGDYDNLALGGSIVVSKAGLGKAYFSLFLDEARFNHPDFFGNYANMYSFQTGIKGPVPGLPMTTAVLQYTKVEPYTYSHYYVDDSPWYPSSGDDNPGMETGYMNGGEALGSGLEPNTDEIMLGFESLLPQGISLNGGYRLVRHGIGQGSSFASWDDSPEDAGAYNTNDSKDFLKDGTYQWFHIGTLGGEWDLSSKGQPVSIGLSYSYVFSYYTDYKSNGDFTAIDTVNYENDTRHLMSLSVKIFP